MKIIEFCGNPGCGKSTLCDKLETALQANGYHVLNLQKHEKCDSLTKKLKKLKNTFSYLMYRGNKNLKKLLYALANGNVTKKWANRILEANWLLSGIDADSIDYVLFDEGILQFFCSMETETAKWDQNLMDWFKNFYSKNEICVLYCHLDESENIKRLKKRNRDKDRFLDEDEKIILQRLLTREKMLKRLIERIDLPKIYEIDMNQDDTAIVGSLLNYERKLC